VIQQNRLDELEQFKTRINLTEYMASRGYEIDRKESSHHSAVMRHSDGDKLIVARDTDQHWVYFSVRNESDNGSIIDFMQKRDGVTLGHVRKSLRPWIGEEPKPVPARKYSPTLRPTNRSRQSVIYTYAKAKAVPLHPYLKSRGINKSTQLDPRFYGVIRKDDRGNALFPHYDLEGLSGYEIKNKGFTGFSRGGIKAAWFSGNINHCDRVVIVESGIDALSHAQIHKEPGSGYLSIGGKMSQQQRELLKRVLIKAVDRGAVIEIATDRDEGGKELAQDIRDSAPSGAVIERREPDQGKDWNEQLQTSKARSSRGYSMGM